MYQSVSIRRIVRAAACVLLSLCIPAYAQLRIVSWNTATSYMGPRAGTERVLEQIGLESVNGIARPIDVLLLQEQETVSGTTQAFADLLNTIYSGNPQAVYARGTYQAGTAGAGRVALVYNTQTVTLVSEQVAVDSTRDVMQYRLRPVGYDSSAEFYAYVHHYKAGSSSSDQNTRYSEAVAIRGVTDRLPQGTHIIYAGDYNMQSSSESAFQKLISSGNGQAFDPINRLGYWHDSYSYRDIHTQSPTTSSANGLIPGGMDDRFDLQLVTDELLDNEGLSYISSSYRAFGNNGTHSLNGAITSGYWPGTNSSQRDWTTLSSLQTASDHLPVVADYQIPAVMAVQVGSASSPVITGASVAVVVTVTNDADVATVNGADELDYTVSTTGDLVGSYSGSDDALGGGQMMVCIMDTSTPGQASGTVQVTSTSQAVQNGSYTSPAVQVDVQAHSEASFDADSDTNTLTIDFGQVQQDSGTIIESFSLYNLVSVLGTTAALDLDSIQPAGDTAVLGTDLAVFSDLPAGQSNDYQATLDSSTEGTFQATYTLSVSDADLPGASAGDDLTITLTANVISPAPTCGDGDHPYPTGDFTQDCHVEWADFGIFADNWQASSCVSPDWCSGTDLTQDGSVEWADFGIFADNWQACTNPGGC